MVIYPKSATEVTTMALVKVAKKNLKHDFQNSFLIRINKLVLNSHPNPYLYRVEVWFHEFFVKICDISKLEAQTICACSTLVRQFMYAIIAQCGNDFYSDFMWNQMWQFFEAQKLQFFKTLLEAVHSDFWENYTFENVENPEISK